MINFNSLQLVINNKYSFVGIDKQEDSSRFCLPKGFNSQKSQLDNFNSKRDLFFLFYKILTTFKSICLERGYLDNNSKQLTNDRDGVVKTKIGSNIEDDGEDNENIFYSKIDILGKLLDAYNEPKILSLASRLGKTDKFDLSKIHKYLHQGVYLPNNAIYVDQMLLPKKVVQFKTTDIVAMYCYLFCEIKQQLKETINPKIISLGEDFRERYLNSQDSLFDENTYESVLNLLKDALETIDNYTAIKDADYWEYYDAIELFLYGDLNQAEEGEIWGIKNFHTVWESMCLTYLAENNDLSCLLHCDTRYLSSRIIDKLKASEKVIDIDNVFKINGVCLNPDAILFNLIKSNFRQKTTYEIFISRHDNYGYKTNFRYDNGFKTYQKGKSIFINIAYPAQKQSIYTAQELGKIYQNRNNQYLIINSPLPKNFYSFWAIPEIVNNEHLNLMSYFNHFFYLALKNKIFTWNSFYEKFLKPLNINFGDDDDFNEYNVFTRSLFRDKSEKYISSQFNQFMTQIFNSQNTSVKIIDIKYHDSDYFFNTNHKQENKEKNVRKQFVYEYLLQKRLKQHFDSNYLPNIESSFWIPDYRSDDSNLFKKDQVFLDDYIELNKVNFLLLAENYSAY
ncbi:hypothetical protein WEU38_00900 [Cyanobacterium aponinum AL20118]|uniref:Uncharacterized protein n=1 Tax=Cyanobacterium aponinum AL20115 TaxID=3090662 RepID=A0AAF0Z9G6_9CHRO|nr:hypothetical protein [Cyanobacterium aponinum]WPF88861.1 hypothetical protein SAY89_00905 [Cyanobacterium aponinum AL20115]